MGKTLSFLQKNHTILHINTKTFLHIEDTKSLHKCVGLELRYVYFPLRQI